MNNFLHAGTSPQYVTNQVNSAFHPSRVTKSLIYFTYWYRIYHKHHKNKTGVSFSMSWKPPLKNSKYRNFICKFNAEMRSITHHTCINQWPVI